MKPLTKIGSAIVISWSSIACAQEAAPKPLAAGVRAEIDIPYVTNGHERQKLDLYLPEESDQDLRPVLIRIHGGAWRHGDKSAQRSVSNYVKQGYIGVAINYRFSQHAVFPAQIEDCKAAIRWLRAHANEYGIDPDRIAVMGSSAGGHLAALLGTTGDTEEFEVGENLEHSSEVCAVIDFFGPTDFLQALRIPGIEWKLAAVNQLLGGTITEKRELAIQANPINYASGADPPFLILHGDADPLVPLSQSAALHATLEAAGVSSEYYVVNGGAHGGEAFKTHEYKILLKEFLAKRVQGVQTGP